MPLLLTKETIDTIIANVPGSYGLYSVGDHEIHKLYNSVNLQTAMGFTEEEYEAIISNPILLIQPEQQEDYWNDLYNVTEDLEHISEVENVSHMLRKDGRIIPVVSIIRYIGVYQDLPVVLAMFRIDWNQRIEDYEQVLNLQALYETALRKTEIAVWEYDIIHHRNIIAKAIYDDEFKTRTHIPHVITDVPYSLTKYIEDRYVDDFVEMYQAINRGEPSASCEVWLKGDDDNPRSCQHMVLTTVYDEQGYPTKAFGLGQDVTSRKIDEELYNSINNQFESILPLAIVSARLNLSENRILRFISNNPRIDSEATRSADDYFIYAGKYVMDAELQKQYFETFNCEHLIHLYKKHQTKAMIEFPVIYPNGKVQFVELTTTMSMNPATRSIEALVYAMDITERVLREHTIHELANKSFYYVATIAYNSRVIKFISHDKAVGIKANDQMSFDTFVNDYCMPLMIRSEQDELLEKTNLDMIYHTLKTGQDYITRMRHIVGGKERFFQFNVSWLIEDYNLMLLTCLDVTESYAEEMNNMRRMEDALLATERANEAKTEFVSRISHDIRTPIGIINNMTDFAFKDIDDPQALLDDLKKIKSADSFLMSLINDVLDISKIDSGKVELHTTQNSLSDMYDNIYHIVESLCDGKHLDFDAEFKGIDDDIYVDTVRFNQVTLNLLSNAANYTPEGGRLSYTFESIPVDNQHIRVVSTIRDTGIGISKEFQQKMFEPFSQDRENNLNTNGDMGTGLGLAIVKGLIDLMKGQISVHSELGVGTTFVWEAVFDRYEEDFEEDNEELISDFRPLDGRVLLVEDNMLNRVIAKRLMEEFEVEVDCANNGREGLTMFADSPLYTYDMILMDLHMPLMDGYETTRQIRSLDRKDAITTPIVAISADAFAQAMRKSAEFGMNGYITKPLSVEQVYAVLAQHLAEKE
ncbi:MAG: response regulator [Erysipelotrichaceae bacterium]|nr:response regulator [Erysipelotrichaceae bacterium]